MIICGKCGFTQPRDVYCANCGINLEKYKPEQPPKWIKLAKDPLSQITAAIIASVAVFFLVINNPKQSLTIPPSEIQLSEPQGEEVTETAEPQPDAEAITKSKMVKKTKTSIKDIQKQFAQKPIAPVKPKAIEKTEITETKEEEPSPVEKIQLVGSFNFYEITPNQLEKYFTSNARVQASVVDSSDIELSLSNFSKTPIEKQWGLNKSKTTTFDYMLEPEDGSEAQGIKFVATNNSTDSSRDQNISLRVTANIPSQDGTNTSIEWSRSFDVTSGKSVLVKIRLPDTELPANFVEEVYNSPLSIMANPQYLDQKLQLLMLLKL